MTYPMQHKNPVNNFYSDDFNIKTIYLVSLVSQDPFIYNNFQTVKYYQFSGCLPMVILIAGLTMDKKLEQLIMDHFPPNLL